MIDELGVWLHGPGPLLWRVRAALRGESLSFGVIGADKRGGPSLFEEEAAVFAEDSKPSEAELEKAGEELRRFSEQLYDAAFLCWMSAEGLESLLLKVAGDAGQGGSGLITDYSRESSRLLGRGCAKVEREIHRLIGLARFSPRRDGTHAAVLEPDHLILPAMAPHFIRRFGSEPFALIDGRRELALLWRDSSLTWWRGDEVRGLLPDQGESETEELWRSYFRATESPERRNPRLQRRFMPERYWRHLTELSDGSLSR